MFGPRVAPNLIPGMVVIYSYNMDFIIRQCLTALLPASAPYAVALCSTVARSRLTLSPAKSNGQRRGAGGTKDLKLRRPSIARLEYLPKHALN